MKQQLLLLEDVRKLGRKGDLVSAKPGFVRNFLLPQNKAIIASKGALRMRERLQQERADQAVIDKTESEKLAKVIEGKSVEHKVKVDGAGHLYGSVSAVDIVRILSEEGVDIEKQHVDLPKPIKKLGTYTISLILSEGVPASFQLNVIGEGGMTAAQVKEAAKEEAAKEEATQEAVEESSEEVSEE